ncbi:MAG: YceI family protein, partial [Nocardioidaceae bacterium]
MSSDILSTDVPAGTWNIDPSHSEIGFTARHLMSKVRGRFEKFEGSIVTGESPSATVSVDLHSINTHEENRDAHLRSGDFFDVEQNGPMTFATTSVTGGGKGLLATGDLSIKGVTKSVELDVELLGSEGDPWGGTRVGFEGTTSISRKHFGIDFNIPLDGGRLMIG